MRDYFEDYEAEVFRDMDCDVWLHPEDREALEEALSRSLEILKAPGETDSEETLRVAQALEELHPGFTDTLVSDGIAEVIELLHEISEERILDFEVARDAKRTVDAIAHVLELELTCPDHGPESFEERGASDEVL